MTPFAIKITTVRLICWKFSGVRRVFSTGKFALIRVPQYWIIGVKCGCKGTEYSKMLKKPLLSTSTGILSDTLIYHNACIVYFSNLSPSCLSNPRVDINLFRRGRKDTSWYRKCSTWGHFFKKQLWPNYWSHKVPQGAKWKLRILSF